MKIMEIKDLDVFCSYNIFRLEESKQELIKKYFLELLENFKKTNKLPIVSKHFSIQLKCHKKQTLIEVFFEVSEINNKVEIILTKDLSYSEFC